MADLQSAGLKIAAQQLLDVLLSLPAMPRQRERLKQRVRKNRLPQRPYKANQDSNAVQFRRDIDAPDLPDLWA